MRSAAVVLGLVLAVPMSWFSGLLLDRVPDNRPLWQDLPGLRLRGPYLGILLVTLVVFAVTGWRFGDDRVGELAVYLPAFGLLVGLAFIDLDTLRLPDRIVAPLLAALVPAVTVASVVGDDRAAINYALAGAGLYFGFLFLAHLAFPRGMGFGDVKVVAIVGLLVGWQAVSGSTAVSLVLYAMVAGFVVGSLVGIGLFAVRGRSAAIPFGPFLVFGGVLVVLAAPALLPVGA